MVKIKFYTHIRNAAEQFPDLARQMKRQTLIDFEWVIRDNASDDDGKTQAAIKAASEKDERIFPIYGTENNLEYSASLRGKLKDCAENGSKDYEYFGIIDGDDIVDKSYAEILYNLAVEGEDSADFVVASFDQFNDGDRLLTPIKSIKAEPQIIIGNKVERGDKFQTNLMQMFPPWCKICKKDLAEEAVIGIEEVKSQYYKEGEFSFNSDAIDNIYLLTHSKKTIFTDKILYHYRQSTNTHSRKLPDVLYIKTIDYIRQEIVKAEKHFNVYITDTYSDMRTLETLAKIMINISERDGEEFERAKIAVEILKSRIFNYPVQRSNAYQYVAKIYNDFFKIIDFSKPDQVETADALNKFLTNTVKETN